ncbi:MAG TPA: HRDC domain-containing protein, partial [Myxococcota bacterium]
THEFFLERDYPETKKLARLFAVLGTDPQSADDARRSSGLDAEKFAAALDKLWVHGGCVVNADQQLLRGTDAWREPYEKQRAHKEQQIDLMLRFADGGRCRMEALLDHFGDKDGGGPCGICDVCAPESCQLHTLREPSESETEIIEAALRALAGQRDGMSTGKLWQAAGEPRKCERRTFERLLKSLARAGAVALEETSFMKDGQRIAFTKARLTGKAAAAGLRVVHDDDVATKARGRAARTGRAGGGRGKLAERAAQHPEARGEHVEALRQLRLAAAKEGRVPAFRILTDASLFALAAARPASLDDIAQVRGVNKRFIEKYGNHALAIFADA